MTPAEWTTFVEAYWKRKEQERKDDIRLAWMIANFTNARELPSLASLLAPPIEVVELPPQEAARQAAMSERITAKMDAIRARRERRAKK